MFGHQDDQQHDESQHDNPMTQEVTPDQQPAEETAQDNGTAAQDDQSQQADTTDNDNSGPLDTYAPVDDAAPDATTSATSDDSSAWQHPGEPLDSGVEPINDIIAPAGGHNPAPNPHAPRPSFSNAADDTEGAEDDSKLPHELIDIKQKALNELVPVINQLEQTPEDRFRTLMMMIQASDDQNLIKDAYEAAEGIEDEKTKGQALLDIVNEINYFTQHPEPEN